MIPFPFFSNKKISLNIIEMKIRPIETYVANNNPDDVLVLLKDLGSPKPKDHEDMIRLLHRATDMYPEKAFEGIAKIETPYYNLIMQYMKPVETKHSNCSGGCSGCDGGKSSCDGGKSSCDGGKSSCDGCVDKCGGNSSVNGADLSNMPEPTVRETIVEKIKETPEKAKTFINEHPVVAGAMGTALLVLAVVGLVKLIK